MSARSAATLGIAAIALALSGCPGFGDETLAEREGIDEVPTWERDIEPLFERHCWSCHGDPTRANAPFSLVTYEQAVARRDAIRRTVVELGSMPKTGPLPDRERALVDAWIAGGTPRGEPPADAGPPADMGPPPDQPTWDDPIAGIFAEHCTACHAGAEPFGGLDLSSYEGFRTGGFSGDLTGGGDPDRSLLIDRLRARRGLPLMPQGGPMLPEETIALIEAWIAAGAPESAP